MVTTNLCRKIYQDGTKEELEDCIACECQLSIYSGDEILLDTTCSPGNFQELAAGFFWTEYQSCLKESQIVCRRDSEYRYQIRIEIDEKKNQSENQQTDATVKEEQLLLSELSPTCFMEAQKQLMESSDYFKCTGNFHCAALCRENRLCYVGEDISRHNAMYKAIGTCILQGDMLKHYYLCTTGRAHAAMLRVAQRAGISVFVSRSAPTDYALSFAREHDMTVIGFASKSRVTYYE